MTNETIIIEEAFVSPYKLAKAVGCLPQAIYQQVRNGVGMLGKAAVIGETGKWQIPGDVAQEWANRYLAKKQG
jgi:hypothetical protein